MRKETFYFSHDYNASMDDKIVKLLSKHGMTGYGIFWRLVECLYNNRNVLELDYDRIAYELHVTDPAVIKSVIHDFNLFVIKDNFFKSASIERRLAERDEKCEKARQSVLKRWNKDATTSENDTNVTENNTNVPKNDTIKERKGNKRKNVFIPPNMEEVKKYFKENGYKEETAIRAYRGYHEANWIDSKGNPVLNWKQKMTHVWFTDENKIKQGKINPETGKMVC